MRLEDVLPAYREGKTIQLIGVAGIMKFQKPVSFTGLSSHEFYSDQWSIVEEPVTITREQFERAWYKVVPMSDHIQVEDLWAELQKK